MDEYRVDPRELDLRRQAARRRGLILDDDGDLVYAEQTARGPDAFCDLRLRDCLETPVDSVAWCIMWGIAAKGECSTTRYWQTQKHGVPFLPDMPDPTPVVVDFCRDHGLGVFGSIRMNDCHDAFGMPFGTLAYPLKAEHPEFLLGDESQRGEPFSDVPSAMWSGLDFARDEVRKDRLWWIEHTASAYDVDGVDLNFFRMPWFFKPGEESRHVHRMTDLVRQARQRLDAIAGRRNRPVLLGVRVLDTVDTCLGAGLDVEAWLKEGLIDRMLVGGGYAPFSTEAAGMIALGHEHNTPVYPCLNVPMKSLATSEHLRGAAANMWEAGADGLYLWNFHYLTDAQEAYGRVMPETCDRLNEIGDPARLRFLNKTFSVDVESDIGVQYRRPSAPCPLPRSLGAAAGERSASIPIQVGDDVPSASENGKIEDVALNLLLPGGVAGDRLAIRLNDTHLGDVTLNADEPARARITIHPEAVRCGTNHLDVALVERGPTARQEVTLERVNLEVVYRA